MRTAPRFPIYLLFALTVVFSALARSDERPPEGQFANGQCISCHERRDAHLIAAWRASSHARTAPKADCVTCHGTTHAGSLARARRDSACESCHEKISHETVNSYATSKHAVIVKLQGDTWDWSRPLARGNYRAPDCAYCHLHMAEHNTRLSLTPWDPSHTPDEPTKEATLSQRQAVCGDCHAPRYVAEQTHTGLRMIEIARMKVREARDAINGYKDTTRDDRDRLQVLFADMQEHARNVRLGVGHQSPDYQWWHGHPALDGDLIRIKGVISDEQRRRALPGGR